MKSLTCYCQFGKMLTLRSSVNMSMISSIGASGTSLIKDLIYSTGNYSCIGIGQGNGFYLILYGNKFNGYKIKPTILGDII